MAYQPSAKEVAALRNRTGAGMMDCRNALVETNGDIEKAVDLLRQRGITKGEKRAGRGASEGLLYSYVHFNGKIAVLVEVNCETDFVARTDDFQNLAKDVALHIASANPIAVSPDQVPKEVVERERAIYDAQVAEAGKPEAMRGKIVDGKIKKFFEERVLLEQPFVKDDKQRVGDLVKALSGKTGENIVVRRFVRWELGEEI
ncbi:MAG: translation elongation factor Ts [Gemmatimonadetes bacterium]|nr:translation elongation factor Ts [Gemmatimonadota bacterium]